MPRQPNRTPPNPTTSTRLWRNPINGQHHLILPLATVRALGWGHRQPLTITLQNGHLVIHDAQLAPEHTINAGVLYR